MLVHVGTLHSGMGDGLPILGFKDLNPVAPTEHAAGGDCRDARPAVAHVQVPATEAPAAASESPTPRTGGR